jgi:hypothetical protein
MTKWDHKDEWRRFGPAFLVMVSRHTVVPSSVDPYEGPNRWAVYAYIYPAHRLFGDFHGPAMRQPAAVALPLHGGPSLLRWYYADDGKPTSVQIGADYNHLHDTHFTSYATAEEAFEVFADAERLFDSLGATVAAVEGEKS